MQEGTRVPRGYRKVVPAEIITEQIGGGVTCPECTCGNRKRTTPQPCGHCGAMEITDPVKTIRRLIPRYVEIECCGRMLICDGFTRTCPHCDADYNWNGTRLSPRRFWGEETGEVF